MPRHCRNPGQSAPQRIQLTLPAVCFSPTSLQPKDQCQAAAPDNPRHHRLDVEHLYAPSERTFHARHETYDAYQRITLTSAPTAKMTVYGDLLRAMLADQFAFLGEPSHPRVITEDNGLESLRMSVRATQLAASS